MRSLARSPVRSIAADARTRPSAPSTIAYPRPRTLSGDSAWLSPVLVEALPQGRDLRRRSASLDETAGFAQTPPPRLERLARARRDASPESLGRDLMARRVRHDELRRDRRRRRAQIRGVVR